MHCKHVLLYTCSPLYNMHFGSPMKSTYYTLGLFMLTVGHIQHGRSVSLDQRSERHSCPSDSGDLRQDGRKPRRRPHKRGVRKGLHGRRVPLPDVDRRLGRPTALTNPRHMMSATARGLSARYNRIRDRKRKFVYRMLTSFVEYCSASITMNDEVAP